MRQIADELGINKASLYYYFDSKEAIVQALFEQRGDEAEELVSWLRRQVREPGLLEAAVLRWVESFATEKLQGIRFMAANPLIAHTLTAVRDNDRIGTNLNTVADEITRLLPNPTPESAVLLRMAVLSINAAVQAAARTDVPDQAIVAAAQRAATALLAEVIRKS